MRLLRRTTTLLLAIVAATAMAAAAAAERKVALVIGNAAYKGSPLANPANDARDMAAKLGKLGYEVILKTDVGLRDMSRAVTLFGQKLGEGSVALVYYAGHGIQARGRNYLIPVDAEIGQESSIRSEAIDVDQVLEQLQPARVSVVILDACRNNPFERRFRAAAGGGLAQMDAPKGTLIAYATAPGKVAADGEGRNGLYTAQLLKALDSPGRRVEDVFKQVRNAVSKATGDQQIPWESSSLTGDLYLAEATTGTVAAPTAAAAVPAKATAPATATDPAAIELEFWRSVEKSGKPDDYRAYLNKYPQGQFAELARMRVRQGETPAAVRPAAAETKAAAPAPAPVAAPTQAPAANANWRDLDAGMKAYADGRYAEAARSFRRATETLPANSQNTAHAHFGLGLALAASGDCQGAVPTLERAAGTWPDHPKAAHAWREVAACEKALDHPFKATRAVKTLLEKYPNSGEAAWARRQMEQGEMRQPRQPRPQPPGAFAR